MRNPPFSERFAPGTLQANLRLGIARDEAFHFYYADNLESLARAGVEWVPFSPLADADLPADLDGLYFGGGYPEVHAARLSDNAGMLADVREFVAAGGLVYAECGGLMYLGRALTTLDGVRYPLAGVLPIETAMLEKLKVLGYTEVAWAADSLWGAAGEVARGHEFHYSQITAQDGPAERLAAGLHGLPPPGRARPRRALPRAGSGRLRTPALGIPAPGDPPLPLLLRETTMNDATDATGILIISHGSPRAEANQGFQAMVARVASRLHGAEIAPAFFSITRPDIPDQVLAMASRGVRRILLMPYFLYSGQHVTVDIPALLDECRQQCPQVTLELLPTLENDPALEDLLVERLTPL